jgi:hypothetical protein
MKKLLFGSFLAIGSLSLQAQDCTKFFPVGEGDVMEFSHYDAKGKLESTSKHTIKESHEDGQTFYWTTLFQTFKPNGKMESENTAEMSCSGSEFKLDMRSMMNSAQMQGMEGMDVSIEGGDMVFPGTLTVGQALPDASMKITASMNGMTLMSMSMNITNRKVVAKETITTPAGTFDCFKLEEDVDMKSIVSYKGHNVSWMAAGAGMVKSMSYDSKGALVSRTELTKLSL